MERRRERRANAAVTHEILMLEAIFVGQNKRDYVFSSYIVGVFVSNVCVLKDRCNMIKIGWATYTFVYIQNVFHVKNGVTFIEQNDTILSSFLGETKTAILGTPCPFIVLTKTVVLLLYFHFLITPSILQQMTI